MKLRNSRRHLENLNVMLKRNYPQEPPSVIKSNNSGQELK